MMPTDHIAIETRGAVRLIWLDREAKRNAVTTGMMHTLGRRVAEAATDDAVRVIVIGGRGRHFCAGGDMAEMLTHDAIGTDAVMAAWQDNLEIIERSPKPVIAMVQGAAFGGGTEIAIACHLRVVSEDARFAQTEIALDHIPGGGGTQRLPRLVPLAIAYEMLLTGREMGAEEALRLGFVNAVHPRDELLARTLAFADRIAARAPVAIRYTMEAVRTGLLGPLEAGMRLERSLASLAGASPEARAGMEQFFGAGRRRPTEAGE